ncbi:MAG TPA: efflux RND transporter periplasmic adaptor subunit [Thermoanaerobaculaceae bacterium]|nr:efflux RND transporter periplasmic adaptor subunit [Thermoanaerobaculaceae bacterium]
MKTMFVKSTLPPKTLHLAVLPALTATTILLAACGGGEQQRRVQPVVPITAAKVVEKTVPVTFRAIGHVEPIATVAIKARIGGELQKAWFAEGQGVPKGATLFTIDARQYEAALRLAEAQLAKDAALLAKAESDTRRYQGLVKQDFVTKEQYEQIVATAAALRAAVEADQASVDNARLQVAYCTITAPIEGRTGTLNVKVGNLVKADDSTPLVTINQMRPIFASFSVPAQLLPQLTKHDGNRITVTATLPQNPGPAEEGTLTFVDNAVDTATGTILLKATFANQDERLWPGQFVDIVVTLGEEPNRIVVPAPAVQTSQQGQYVFVVKDDQTVELRPVKVDRMDEAEAVIEKGLTAGETVVTDGQLRLIPGVKVEIKTGLGSAEKQT